MSRSISNAFSVLLIVASVSGCSFFRRPTLHPVEEPSTEAVQISTAVLPDYWPHTMPLMVDFEINETHPDDGSGSFGISATGHTKLQDVLDFYTSLDGWTVTLNNGIEYNHGKSSESGFWISMFTHGYNAEVTAVKTPGNPIKLYISLFSDPSDINDLPEEWPSDMPMMPNFHMIFGPEVETVDNGKIKSISLSIEGMAELNEVREFYVGVNGWEDCGPPISSPDYPTIFWLCKGGDKVVITYGPGISRNSRALNFSYFPLE